MKSTILTIAFAMIAGFALAADDKKGDDAGKGKGKGKGDPAARAEMMLKKLDTDKDGKISKEEFLASPMAKKAKDKGGDPEKNFTRLDANKDGFITKDELAKMGKGKGKGKGKPEDAKKPE